MFSQVSTGIEDCHDSGCKFSFSRALIFLRRMKTYLWTTMSQERLSNLALLYVEIYQPNYGTAWMTLLLILHKNIKMVELVSSNFIKFYSNSISLLWHHAQVTSLPYSHLCLVLAVPSLYPLLPATPIRYHMTYISVSCNGVCFQHSDSTQCTLL